MRHLLNETVLIKNRVPGSADRYGDETEVYDDGTSFPARIQQAKAEEMSVDRDTTLTTYKVFLPPEASVDAMSVVVWNGKTLEIVGEPDRVMGYRRINHIEAFMQEVRG